MEAQSFWYNWTASVFLQASLAQLFLGPKPCPSEHLHYFFRPVTSFLVDCFAAPYRALSQALSLTLAPIHLIESTSKTCYLSLHECRNVVATMVYLVALL